LQSPICRVRQPNFKAGRRWVHLVDRVDRRVVLLVQRAIEPYGLRLSGEFRQLNASPTFALLRLETTGQALWFKAVGEPNLREFPIPSPIETLSRLRTQGDRDSSHLAWMADD